MQNVLKPFGAKGTAFVRKHFFRTRVALTVLYLVILAAMLMLSGAVTRALFVQRLSHRFAPAYEGHGPRHPSPAEVREDLQEALFIVNAFLVAVAGAVGYWLAGVTLAPIQEAYGRERQFLSDASHELRTPLAVLQTDLENQIAATSNGEDRARLESHLEEVHKMGTLVHDLLTLSRLDESNRPAPLQSVDIVQVVVDTVRRLSPSAQRKGVAIMSSVPDVPVHILADQSLLSRAIENVVQNAITYNKQGGTVEVRLSVEGKEASIRVSDTGIGIAERHLTRIFDRFYRADESRARDTGGSGLGLAITKSIIAHFGGSIGVHSVVDRGTAVTIVLPVHKAS